jgi:rhomboid family GlyGly-CTERM serine protease
VLLVAACCLALALGGDEARAWGRYERGALESGEYWRLLTGHLVHLGWGHLWPNLAALVLIGALFDDVLAAPDWLLAAIAAAAAIDVGLYVVDTNVQWYVGLSGVLHGLVAAGAFVLLMRRSGLGALLAIGLSAKLVFEQTFGPVPFTESAAGGPVVVAAHVYGAAGGFVGALGSFAVRRRRSRL